MFRILYLLVLAMLSYFSMKSLFKPPKIPAPKKEKPKVPGVNFKEGGEMVEDPVCGTYVEAESAVFVIHEDKKIYFCSKACQKKFLATQNG